MISKSLIMFLIGFVTGGSAGAIGTTLYYKKKVDDLIDEVEELEEEVDNKLRRKKHEEDSEEVNPRSKYLKSSETENGRDKGTLSPEERQAIKEKLDKNWEQTTNYASMYDGGEPDDDEESPSVFNENGYGVALDMEANEFHQKNRNIPPRIISADSIGSLPAYFEKETFFFYPEVGILTDEENREIMDPETYLGDSLTKYGFDENNEKNIFVVNYSTDTLFEVQKMEGEYVSMVN